MCYSLRRTLVVLEVLGAGFFVSSEAVSYLALNFQENLKNKIIEVSLGNKM